MRAPALILAALALSAAPLPALAQLSGGMGNFNAANQAFQQENTFRGLQQQQTFNNNQIQLNSSVDRMNAAPVYGGYGYGYGRRPVRDGYRSVNRRPERER